MRAAAAGGERIDSHQKKRAAGVTRFLDYIITTVFPTIVYISSCCPFHLFSFRLKYQGKNEYRSRYSQMVGTNELALQFRLSTM